ncbi:type II secretion system F family protein [Lachnospiraceae bacterium LCP25S3_G4]
MEQHGPNKPLSNIEISSFCSQMAMILQAGISTLEGISIMQSDAKDSSEESILKQLYETMITTGNFYESLEESGVFPNYMLYMVNIGEETGKLDEVMISLSEHYEREDTITKTIKNAVTYPLIMIGMMILVILVLIVKVMPIFNQVFQQLGQEMTGLSKGILHIGTTINHYSIFFTVLLILFISFTFYVTKTKNGQATLMTIGYKCSFSKTIYNEIAACRFASGMALTLSSGLNPEQSIELVSKLIENHIFQKKIAVCDQLIRDGENFEVALLKSTIFSGVYARMASIGSKTGSLDEVMKKIAARYEEDIDTKISHILSILEPTLVISLSIIVGIILLSVMLPLMSIMSNIS